MLSTGLLRPPPSIALTLYQEHDDRHRGAKRTRSSVILFLLLGLSADFSRFSRLLYLRSLPFTRDVDNLLLQTVAPLAVKQESESNVNPSDIEEQAPSSKNPRSVHRGLVPTGKPSH